MKLTQLEYFCVAARYHNITRASKELFVTQPSVSNAIKALEEEFGVNLFYRNNNKLTLTPEGEKFYQNAEELLAHADAVRSELHELRKQITPVRLSLIHISEPTRRTPISYAVFCLKKKKTTRHNTLVEAG